MGCGVTARDKFDAEQIISSRILKDYPNVKIAHVEEDVDISSLDEGHVIPNMNPHIWRGIWFPKGYEDINS